MASVLAISIMNNSAFRLRLHPLLYVSSVLRASDTLSFLYRSIQHLFAFFWHEEFLLSVRSFEAAEKDTLVQVRVAQAP